MARVDPDLWVPIERSRRRLVVSDNRVACPRRGEVDIETCFCCRHFRPTNSSERVGCHDPQAGARG